MVFQAAGRMGTPTLINDINPTSKKLDQIQFDTVFESLFVGPIPESSETVLFFVGASVTAVAIGKRRSWRLPE